MKLVFAVFNEVVYSSKVRPMTDLVSLHETEGGALKRLGELADNLGVPIAHDQDAFYVITSESDTIDSCEYFVDTIEMEI